jgi:hypothetical protein
LLGLAERTDTAERRDLRDGMRTPCRIPGEIRQATDVDPVDRRGDPGDDLPRLDHGLAAGTQVERDPFEVWTDDGVAAVHGQDRRDRRHADRLRRRRDALQERRLALHIRGLFALGVPGRQEHGVGARPTLRIRFDLDERREHLAREPFADLLHPADADAAVLREDSFEHLAGDGPSWIAGHGAHDAVAAGVEPDTGRVAAIPRHRSPAIRGSVPSCVLLRRPHLLARLAARRDGCCGRSQRSPATGKRR